MARLPPKAFVWREGRGFDQPIVRNVLPASLEQISGYVQEARSVYTQDTILGRKNVDLRAACAVGVIPAEQKHAPRQYDSLASPTHAHCCKT